MEVYQAHGPSVFLIRKVAGTLGCMDAIIRFAVDVFVIKDVVTMLGGLK